MRIWSNDVDLIDLFSTFYSFFVLLLYNSFHVGIRGFCFRFDAVLVILFFLPPFFRHIKCNVLSLHMPSVLLFFFFFFPRSIRFALICIWIRWIFRFSAQFCRPLLISYKLFAFVMQRSHFHFNGFYQSSPNQLQCILRVENQFNVFINIFYSDAFACDDKDRISSWAVIWHSECTRRINIFGENKPNKTIDIFGQPVYHPAEKKKRTGFVHFSHALICNVWWKLQIIA